MNNTKENYVKLTAGAFLGLLAIVCIDGLADTDVTPLFELISGCATITGMYVWGFMNGHMGAEEWHQRNK